MEQQVLRTINLISSRVGILSLTERFDSLPMWAHYGVNAKGYILEFDNLAEEFPGDSTGNLNCIKSVRYVEDIIGLTHDPSTQDNLFFCKFNDWNYERERRVISALRDCQFSADGRMHLRFINPEKITRLICGWNVPHEQVASLAAELKVDNPKLEVRVASLAHGRVVLGGAVV